MSELDSKLELPENSGYSKARQMLKSLMARRGYKVLSRDHVGPIVIEITPMDATLVWVRMQYNEKKRDYWMELQSERPA